jgi:hypothetical protein
VVSRARIRGDPGGEGNGHGDPAVVAPPIRRVSGWQRRKDSGLRRRRVIGLFPCGVRLGFFIYGVGVERMSRQGGGDKKALLVHLFMCSFVLAVCPGSKHQFFRSN